MCVSVCVCVSVWVRGGWGPAQADCALYGSVKVIDTGAPITVPVGEQTYQPQLSMLKSSQV